MYSGRPYVEYIPKEFALYNVPMDVDFETIEHDLAKDCDSIEEYFIENSGFWFVKGSLESEIARQKIATLKENF